MRCTTIWCFILSTLSSIRQLNFMQISNFNNPVGLLEGTRYENPLLRCRSSDLINLYCLAPYLYTKYHLPYTAVLTLWLLHSQVSVGINVSIFSPVPLSF